MSVLFFIFLISEVTLNVSGKLLSENIDSEEELNLILEEEIKKLGLEHVDISAEFGDPPGWSGAAYEISEDRYFVSLGIFGRNTSTLRHELYHIKEGHTHDSGFLDYFFLEEPQAVIYSSLGLGRN